MYMKSTSFEAMILVSGLTVVSGLIVSVFMSMGRISPGDVAPSIARVEEPSPILAPTSTEEMSTSIAPVVAENFFDPAVVKVGDLIGAWRLKLLRPVFGTEATSTSLDNVHAEFEGVTTVTGTYTYDRSEMNGLREIRIHIEDPSEASKIPCARKNCSWAEFKLRDVGTIAPQFGGKFGSGTATLTIKNYIVNSAPTEVSDMAQLVKVLHQKATE